MNPSTHSTTTAQQDQRVLSSMPDPLLTGVSGGLWHAVERTMPPRPGPALSAGPVQGVVLQDVVLQGVALCGLVVQVAQKYDGFDRRRTDRTCPTCAWTHAVRTGTDAVAAELAALDSAGPAGPTSAGGGGLELPVPLRAAARVAAAVLAAADAPGSDHDPTHPATVQLLATVTAHAPTGLLEQDCAEGDCEHDPGLCPIAVVACPACSVRAGSWAGEWEGSYQSECTIPGPCEVLRTLAAHHHVDLASPGQPRAGRAGR